MNIQELVEVEPVEYKRKKNGQTVWYYDSIKVYVISLMGWDELQNRLNIRAINGEWKVKADEEDGDAYFLQFFQGQSAKPLLIILTDDEKLYSSKEQWDLLDHRFVRHHAGFLLGMLHRIHLVQNARHRFFSYNIYGRQIEEYIPDENLPRFRSIGQYEKWLRDKGIFEEWQRREISFYGEEASKRFKREEKEEETRSLWKGRK